MSDSAVAVSAPGKVLFTGGFLVLDRAHTGLVFGLNARIHSYIQKWTPDSSFSHNGPNVNFVLVESPQFREARWLYKVDSSEPTQGEAISVTPILDHDLYTKSRNKFVEITLQYALTYLRHVSKNPAYSLRITILADSDYYSQSTAASAERKNGFINFGVKLTDAHKTGLGSSAALVTSLVATLLAFFTKEHEAPKNITHNLAQAAHCAAQGKVGSGFDIAAAVFGSCLYRRFSPTILESIGEPDSPGFGERLHLCIDDLNLEHKWDVEVSSQAVKIPSSLLLVMCDVDCGSETPGMVRKVLQWRKENPAEAALLWNAIQQGSFDLCDELRRLAELDGLNFKEPLNLGDIIATIRSLVREMSQKSAVPIEPDVITELLNYCTDLPGVIGGVAPGAGGYDAVALLIRNDVEVRRDLEERLETWTSKGQSTGATIGKVRLLGVQQDQEGIRLEDAGRYGGWVQ